MTTRSRLRMTIYATACAACMAACACAPAADAPANTAKAPQSTVSPSASCYLARPDVVEFLGQISEKHGIPLEWLKDEVAVARYSETAERLMTPKPGIRKPGSDVVKSPFRNYLAYARGFLTQERILRGREFIERNAAIFDEIEMKSGVSRYVITAVIGVETFYGRNMGRYRVLDSLMTLSFDYTRRAAFFKEELAHFLEFCWRQEVQPVTVLGSFAGAIGYGQFMPSSLDRWGADGDKDGRIDMVESEPDAIASVARFLTAHGWVAGRGLLYPVRADAEIFDATGSGGIAAHATVEGLRKAGVDTGEHFPLLDDEPVLLVDLPQLDEKGRRTTKWYIGTRNFSSVLRYNRSYFYAAAVAMLANRIAGIDEP
ncbi:MAG: lytic murein transglycosylase [Sutterella wadsworthensis]|nr:lytic murein transglycosylase [uncultured Sutterella sp.]MCI7116605.1 lytic murein transglycosylase [Sutterella wadsworthensis]MDY5223832.1 lytic murein transglycosylase [Sutterella wadsworthensis]